MRNIEGSIVWILALLAASLSASANPAPSEPAASEPADLGPRALSERSAARLAAGDFAGARLDAVNAIDGLDRTPRLQAMAYFNLGRAYEGLGDPAHAMYAYSRSLDLREHAGVRARLSALGPALLASHALAGPFAKPEDFCAGRDCVLGSDIDQVLDANGDPVVDLKGDVEHKVKLPFAAVANVIAGPLDPDADPFARATTNLALQVGAKWYVLPDMGTEASGHGGGYSIEIAMHGSRLVATWTSSVGRFGHTDEVATIVCGVDGAGLPRCYGPIVTALSDTIDHCGKSDCTTPATFVVYFHCAAKVGKDVITVTRSRTAPDNPDQGVQVGPRADACESLPTYGTHALAF